MAKIRKRVSTSKSAAFDLPHKGKLSAPIIVVCEPPKENDEWYKQLILPGEQRDVFIDAAKACGFERDDFLFILPCPSIPEEIQASDKKTNEFLDKFRQPFLDLLAETDPKLIMYLGRHAGRIVTGKNIKIMKNRGAFQRHEFMYNGYVTVLPMLGPRQVLARPENKDIFNSDFIMAERLRDFDWKVFRVSDFGADEKNYRWCLDLSNLIKKPPLAMAVDTETTGLKWFTASNKKDPDRVKVLTAQICVAAGDVRVVPLDCDYYPELTPKQRKKLVHQLRILLERKKTRKTGHNGKYDSHVLREDLGIHCDFDTDTQLLAFLVDENMQEKSLDECIRRWVPSMAGYNDRLNREIDKENMRDCPLDKMLHYAAGDADASFRLATVLTPLAKADKKQWNCYKKIILPAIQTFCDPVELYGVKVNSKKLSELQKELAETEKEMYDSLIRQIPRSIRQKFADPKKPKGGLSFTRDAFVRDYLFLHRDGLRLKARVFTPSTAKLPPSERVPSVSTKTHMPYFQDEPFVAEYMEYVKLAKLLSTYVGVPYSEEKKGPTGFWQYIYNNEIHPSFILHRTVTGRTASASPNGQNFPKRGKLAKAYREIFVARKGYTLIETDLSQAELRIAAWMANEKTMLRIYRQGGDIHAMTAAAVMGLSLKEFMALDKETRDLKRFQAKAVNFGFLYGMGWRKFKTYAKTDYGLEFTDEEAERLREIFFDLYPGLVSWHEKMRAEVIKKGYVRALHGAVRHLPSIKSSEEYIRAECQRQAINSPVQRFASDLGLIAMIRLARDTDPEIMRPVMFIHDALVLEVKDEYLEEARGWVRWYMETPPLKKWFGIEPPLPIIADVSEGKNLGQMEEVKAEPIKPRFYQKELDLAA